MKICLISYDFWNYDRHIVEAVKRRGIEAHHIKMTSYQYPNFFSRVNNAFSKAFLGKNLKNIARQEMILEELGKIGKQDQILVISPETISPEYHEKIKKFTENYIAYLYDALARNPAQQVLHFFDKIYTFDHDDAKKFGFEELYNYNYLNEIHPQEIKTDVIYVGSFDERIKHLEELSKDLERKNICYRFVIVGGRLSANKISKQNIFEFRSEKIPLEKLPDYYGSAKIIVDLVRPGQNGLSFRFFEAMALRKKIITNNASVKNYDFYNPDNIFIIDQSEVNIPKSFFTTPYQELPPEVYKKYTVDQWVETVFSLA